MVIFFQSSESGRPGSPRAQHHLQSFSTLEERATSVPAASLLTIQQESPGSSAQRYLRSVLQHAPQGDYSLQLSSSSVKIPFDVVVEEKCTVVLVQDVTEKASAEPSELRRVEGKATMCHRPKSKLPTALTWFQLRMRTLSCLPSLSLVSALRAAVGSPGAGLTVSFLEVEERDQAVRRPWRHSWRGGSGRRVSKSLRSYPQEEVAGVGGHNSCEFVLWASLELLSAIVANI